MSAPSPALFRFVQVRRVGPPGTQPPPPVDDDVIGQAFDLTDFLLPGAIQVIMSGDRQAARQLAIALMGQLPAETRAVAGTLRRTLRRTATNELLTLGQLRDELGDDTDLPGSPVFIDLLGRAVSVVVLERWAGIAKSPRSTRSIALLRGAVLVRLTAAPLDAATLLTGLLRGRTLLLPDPPAPQAANGSRRTALLRVRNDLPRLSARASAVGLGEDAALAAIEAASLGNLEPMVSRAVLTANQFGIPATAPVSTLTAALDAEIAFDSGFESLEAPPIDPTDPTTPHDPPGEPIPLPSLPVLDARARVLGRGDLMVVRVEHLRYQTGEIAYLENVLASELRARTHVIDTATSEKIIETNELFSETSQELTTTERFELEQAAESANSATTSLSAGMSTSGGFGPVSVGLDLNASRSTTTSSSNSSATSYAREITDKATETLRSSASSRTVTTNRTRITETNKHDFDNRDGTDHIRGIYRWLEKVDQAQVYNYGERLQLEFIVPQPAAQHVYLSSATTASGEPVPPPPLDFGPEDLNEHNFVDKGLLYDASGLERPPVDEVTVPLTIGFDPAVPLEMVSEDFGGEKAKGPQTNKGNNVRTDEVPVPDGYAAGTLIASLAYGGLKAAGPLLPSGTIPPDVTIPPVGIAVGDHRLSVFAMDPTESHVIEFHDRQTGALPIVTTTQQREGVAVAIRVVCYRTSEAYAAWQHRTFTAIQQAYLNKRTAYETTLSVAQVQQAYTAVTPSAVNRAIELRELKRGCQTILTGQDFDMLGSIDTPPGDIPRIDIEEAWIEGDMIQAFEDWIDWANMAYLFYPYQWAGRLQWPELVARTSSDPLHEAFLQAGAARVVVPVREGFERAVTRYLKDGTVPEFGPAPWRGEPTGYPPVDELIADANDRPEDEVAVGEPWEVDAPTTLIYLQADAELNPPVSEEPATAGQA